MTFKKYDLSNFLPHKFGTDLCTTLCQRYSDLHLLPVILSSIESSPRIHTVLINCLKDPLVTI